MTLDRNKPVQTLDGQPVRIITWTEGTKEYPIVGIIGDEDDENIGSWTAEGKYLKGYEYGDNEDDLVNVPGRKSIYVNIHGVGFTTSYQSREMADNSDAGRIGLIRVDLEDGVIVGFEREL